VFGVHARQHQPEDPLPEARRVDEREHAQDAGLLQAPHTRAHGALRDADLPRDVPERAPPVGLQRAQDGLVGGVQVVSHYA
jgi:hypothetical protein